MTRDTNPGLPWREMTGMRHRLIHGYAEVRVEVVSRVVREELPDVIQALAEWLPGE